ncbi:(Fe-S)-binding protein [Methylobacter sp. BlB1]|uniref:(Fe-S)-binding protein n=1 Tax=Methylobacter sp. BlB1 TaxID=2785914 RepID=UPI001894D252|nr:4Fe-4S dicluster domain-containing protein [Methylobacter sp. BlB1]MBF6649726.1 4Fe-4S dicluster domain-containing protein [Methylobacter sp. BlB1]
MKLFLDWSAYQDAGMGDAYADIPRTGGDFAKAVAVCIGSRACEQAGKGVMCPSFRISGSPGLSTGGRVKLLKAALNGEFGSAPFEHDELAEAMDLCVSCKGCKRECENEVDMALIKAEFLAQRFSTAGIPLRNRLFAAVPKLLARFPRLGRLMIRWRNRHRMLAQCGDRLLGISAEVKLPEPVGQPFNAASVRDKLKNDTGMPEVVLFVDTFNRHFNPTVAEAAVSVLTAAGYRVHLLDEDEHAGAAKRPLCCGRTYFANGMIDEARQEAHRLLQALTPHLEADRWIIGLEPSCMLSLRDEYLCMGLGEQARQLAAKVLLLEEFIAREQTAKRWTLAFNALGKQKLLIHGHCHQKAVGATKAMRKVLKLIPELDSRQIESSCCGMAGQFGLESEHAGFSREMAEQGLYPALRAEPDAAVVANGFSCRQQILNGGHAKPLHIAEILYAALGR